MSVMIVHQRSWHALHVENGCEVKMTLTMLPRHQDHGDTVVPVLPPNPPTLPVKPTVEKMVTAELSFAEQVAKSGRERLERIGINLLE